MKVGIIRCYRTRDNCFGEDCFKAIREKTAPYLKHGEDTEIIGFIDCGGCPGGGVTNRAKQYLEKGADTIVLANCIVKENPVRQEGCPFLSKIKKSITAALPANVNLTIIECSHN